jgi:hypothetical protein
MKIKPCPRCECKVIDIVSGGKLGYHCRCNNCRIFNIDQETPNEAITNWNSTSFTKYIKKVYSNYMDTAKAMEIVYHMAEELYKRHGEFVVAKNPAEVERALGVAHDFIMNNIMD